MTMFTIVIIIVAKIAFLGLNIQISRKLFILKLRISKKFLKFLAFTRGKSYHLKIIKA